MSDGLYRSKTHQIFLFCINYYTTGPNLTKLYRILSSVLLVGNYAYTRPYLIRPDDYDRNEKYWLKNNYAITYFM